MLIGGYRAWEEGGLGSDRLKGTGFLWDDENVLKLGRGGWLHNTVNILNATALLILKVVNFMLHESHLSLKSCIGSRIFFKILYIFHIGK